MRSLQQQPEGPYVTRELKVYARMKDTIVARQPIDLINKNRISVQTVLFEV